VSFEIESRPRHCRGGHQISKGMTGSGCNRVRGGQHRRGMILDVYSDGT